jgi:hypothetical protein
MLVRPCRFDLAGQLDADCARADQEYVVCVQETVVRAAVRVDRIGGVVRVAFGWERIGRAGSEHDVVGGELFPGRDHDAARIDVDRAVVFNVAVYEELVVRQENLREVRRVDQRAQRADVVHKCVSWSIRTTSALASSSRATMTPP